MRVATENRQRFATVRRRALENAAGLFARLAKVAPDEVTLILVDDAGIAPINRAAVGHEGATDVITLSYDAIPGDEAGPSAEVILNVQRAISQRPENPSLELAYYLAHAFDHLAGHDDDTPARRAAMHRRERRWLKAAGDAISGILAPSSSCPSPR